MRAVVLAAGRGERLKGILASLPKPMVEMRGRPILEHNIRLLCRHGIADVCINVHHHPEAIIGYFGDGSRFGMRITYSPEEVLLGTAGGVRKIADDWWREPAAFLVLYGDNLLEFDLGAVIAHHRRQGGVGTIAVYEKDDVRQSGIVVVDESGRILRFIEKPAPADVVSHLVNTGLYILEPSALEYVAAGEAKDFGHDVFPAMLAAGESLFAFRVEGSVTAIDTPELLAQARQDEGTSRR